MIHPKLTQATVFLTNGQYPSTEDLPKACDPAPTERQTFGFVTEGVDFPTESGLHLIVQIAQRILPMSAVRKRASKMADDVEAQTGRRPGKKQMKELLADAEMELLPQAFVRYSHILVSFVGNELIVWSSSTRKCDDIITMLVRCTDGLEVRPLPVDPKFVQGVFTDIVSGHEDEYFGAQGVGTWENIDGDDKKVVKVKLVEPESSVIETLMNQSYRPKSIGLYWLDDAEVSAMVKDDLTLSRLTFGVKDEGKAADSANEAYVNTLFIAQRCVTQFIQRLMEIIVTPDGDL